MSFSRETQQVTDNASLATRILGNIELRKPAGKQRNIIRRTRIPRPLESGLCEFHKVAIADRERIIEHAQGPDAMAVAVPSHIETFHFVLCPDGIRDGQRTEFAPDFRVKKPYAIGFENFSVESGIGNKFLGQLARWFVTRQLVILAESPEAVGYSKRHPTCFQAASLGVR